MHVRFLLCLHTCVAFYNEDLFTFIFIAQYLLDFKSSPPNISSVSGTAKADVTIKVSDDNLIQLAEGKLNPMSAFMQGKIKVKGKIALAQKLDTVFKAGQQVIMLRNSL